MCQSILYGPSLISLVSFLVFSIGPLRSWCRFGLLVCPSGAQCFFCILGHIVQHSLELLWNQGNGQVWLNWPLTLHEAFNCLAIDIYGDQLWVGDLLPLSPWLLVSLLENILATAGFQPFVVSLFQQLVQRNGICQAAVLGHVTATYQLHYLVPCGPKFQEGAAIMFHQEGWWNWNGFLITNLDGHWCLDCNFHGCCGPKDLAWAKPCRCFAAGMKIAKNGCIGGHMSALPKMASTWKCVSIAKVW